MLADPEAKVDHGKTWPGSFQFPCHGSKFYRAERVFKDGPASANLVIPPHHYLSVERLTIGDDRAA